MHSMEFLTKVFVKNLAKGLNSSKHYQKVFYTLLYVYQGELKKGLKTIEEELSEYNENAYSHLLKYFVLCGMEEFDDVLIKELKIVENLPNNQFVGDSVWFELAALMRRQKDLKGAQACISRQIFYYPNQKKFIEGVDYEAELGADLLKCIGKIEKRIESLENSPLRHERVYLYLAKARFLLSMKNHSKDILLSLYTKIVEMFPRETSTWRSMIILHIRNKDYKKAIIASNKFLNYCSSKIAPQDYYHRGICFFHTKEYFKAEVNFRIAILLSKGLIQEKYQETLRVLLSKKKYKQSNRVSSDWKKSYNKQRDVRLATYQKAIEEIESAFVGPEDADEVFFLLFLEIIRFYPKLIENLIVRASEWGRRISFWTILKDINMHYNTFDKKFDECIKEHPDWIPVHLFKCFFDLKKNLFTGKEKKRDLDSRKKYFEEHIEYCLEHSQNVKHYNHFLFFMITGYYIDSGEYKKAEKYLLEFEKTVANSNFPSVIIMKARLLQKNGLPEKAIHILEEGIKELKTYSFNFDKGVFYVILSEIYEKQETTMGKSIEMSKRATKENPCLKQPYRFRCDHYLNIGKSEKALHEIWKSIEICATACDFLYSGKCRLRLRDFKGAERDLRVAMVIDVDPNEEVTKECRKLLKKIKRDILSVEFMLDLEEYFDIRIITE